MTSGKTLNESPCTIVTFGLLLNLSVQILKYLSDIFSKLSDIVDCDLGFILPSVIHNIINGQQGLIYGI